MTDHVAAARRNRAKSVRSRPGALLSAVRELVRLWRSCRPYSTNSRMFRREASLVGQRSRWAAGFVVCAVVVCLPRSAAATCGDYLHMPGHRGTHFASLPADREHVPTPERPCQGPSCRQSAPPVTPPTPTTWSPQVEQWACANPAADERPLFSEPHDPAPEAARAGGYPQRVERPPR